MQVKYLHGYHNYQINKLRISPNHPAALKRWDALERFEQALSMSLSSCEAAQIVGIPKATLYRWRARKSKNLQSLVPLSRRPKRYRKSKIPDTFKKRILELRREHPTWGKRKIAWLLRQEGTCAKESTVGRVITEFIKRGSIPSAKLAAQEAGRRARPQRPYAVRLKRGQKLQGSNPGDVIQVDHMSVPMSAGPVIKHFNAVCTVSRWNVADAFNAASAKTAKSFIDKLIQESPFPIRQIQVDGGSEFMAEFEEECQHRGISLAVLAPKSPKLNGHVERINGTWRSDFYDLFDLPTSLKELRPLLNDFTDSYNWDRPHEGLGLQTPQQFLEGSGIQVSPFQSHML